MIKGNKNYTEEFAKEVFLSHMKEDVIQDAAGFSFPEPSFDDLNDITLAKFRYHGHGCRIVMDAINAEIRILVDDKEQFLETFAGLTDHYLFCIGPDGIVDEDEYGHVFCDIYGHLMMYGTAPWVSIAVALCDGLTEEDADPFHIPWDDIEKEG